MRLCLPAHPLPPSGFGRASRINRAVAVVLLGTSLVSAHVTFAADAAEEPQPAPSTLPKVKVTTDEELLDAPPDVYSGGQVARGGQLGLLGNRDIMETPFSMTTYTATLVEDQQAHSLGDVLINDPSVRSNWPRGSYSDNFMIRGFNVSNPNVALDGLYGILPVDHIPVEAVERVEVLKGPSALLNGMSPGGLVGGNINIVPKRAEGEPLTRLTGSYFSEGQYGGQVDIGRRFGAGDSLGVRVNGVFRDGDTTIDRQTEQYGVVTLGIDYLAGATRWSVDLGYQKQEVDAPLRPIYVLAGVAVPDAPDGGSNSFPSWSFVEQKDLYGVLRGEFDVNDRITAFAAIGGRKFDSENLLADPTVTSASGQFTSLVYDFPYDQDSVSAQAGVRGKLQTGPVAHELSFVAASLDREFFSAFISYSEISSNIYSPAFGAGPTRQNVTSDPPKGSESVLSSIGIADSLSMLDDRVLLTLGLRKQQIDADNYSATGAKTTAYDDDAITPGVGLVYRPSRQWSLYGNYIQGLTQGPTAPATALNSGEIFAPVKTKQYETGVKFDAGHVGAMFALFQITQPNGITDSATRIFSVDGEQRNRGAELSVFGVPAAGLRVLGGMSLIDGELTQTVGGVNDGKTAIGVPKTQANVGAEWDAPFLEGITLSGRTVYTSAQYLNATNTQRIPDWTRLDLGVRYRVPGAQKPILVRLNLENILDKSYWASTGGGYLTLGAPRSVLLSVAAEL